MDEETLKEILNTPYGKQLTSERTPEHSVFDDKKTVKQLQEELSNNRLNAFASHKGQKDPEQEKSINEDYGRRYLVSLAILDFLQQKKIQQNTHQQHAE